MTFEGRLIWATAQIKQILDDRFISVDVYDEFLKLFHMSLSIAAEKDRLTCELYALQSQVRSCCHNEEDK